jgi:mRNA-degrading endonuclease toxin of MazEF toxin-antitoxin module
LEIVRPFEVLINKTTENGLERSSKVLGNRLQTVDTAVRLKGFIGIVGPEIMGKVEQALKVVLSLE